MLKMAGWSAQGTNPVLEMTGWCGQGTNPVLKIAGWGFQGTIVFKAGSGGSYLRQRVRTFDP